MYCYFYKNKVQSSRNFVKFFFGLPLLQNTKLRIKIFNQWFFFGLYSVYIIRCYSYIEMIYIGMLLNLTIYVLDGQAFDFAREIDAYPLLSIFFVTVRNAISAIYISPSQFFNLSHATETRKVGIVVDSASILFFHLLSFLSYIYSCALSAQRLASFSSCDARDRPFIHSPIGLAFIHSFV